MARARATQGTVGQFTYDFGVQIAKGTVREITRLTGVSLTLASAFYTLKNTAQEYLDVVTKNNLRMGGIVQAMREYEAANKRLVKGLTFSSPRQQIEGMNELMAAGIDVEKNFEWISKSAHAMGKSFDEFAGAIANGIHGNMGALVDMGLMTQRSTRAFQKYTADTVQRQAAILQFVKTHKGLQAAVKDDFIRIQDEMNRIKGAWNGFIRSIIGDPKNPSSFYGQIRTAVKEVADAIARNYESIRKFGQGIGMVLGWIARQIGHVIVWLGREVKRVSKSLIGTVDNFGEAMRSFVVWLEFWKVKFVKVFNSVYGFLVKHEKLIFRILKLYAALKAINWVWGISSAAIASVVTYSKVLIDALKAQKAYIMWLMAHEGKTFASAWVRSLGIVLPKKLGKVWFAIADGIGRIMKKGVFKWLGGILSKAGSLIGGFFRYIIRFAKGAFTLIRSLFTASNPLGWIMLAITLMVVLYKKCVWFRSLMNGIFGFLINSVKLIWNLLVGVYTYLRIAIIEVSNFVKKYIIHPIVWFFDKVKKVFNMIFDWRNWGKLGEWVHKITAPIGKFFSNFGSLWGLNDKVSGTIKGSAEKYGFNAPTWGTTGNFDSTTDYLSGEGIRSLFNGGSSTETPLVTSMPSVDMPGSSGNTTTIQSGAVQIIVQNGENIDENVLAERVRMVLADLQREGNLRGGR